MSNLLYRLADRVEHLLSRYAELQRTNHLLRQQLAVISKERDALSFRLDTARERVDALIERLEHSATEGAEH